MQNINHTNTIKDQQCKDDHESTRTVHHTITIKPRQCKYDRVRTQRYTIQTRRRHINVSTTACVH
ncbi:hypothetical protein NP493_2315g00008 [Ridgeia piscesae]|uniref:Uncharacterized protein n=1 Tax=Ridgeia piscesae TaxID=27915 RepID=A0AAD9JHS7_RIDPI|nr:hypothetical protein NP493_2315g00008 [Ridgeia piscesae]